jgi:lauroyl/myristoyl acyltransferase
MTAARAGLQRAAGRFPRAAVRAATLVALVTRPLGRGIDTNAIERFFPELGPGEVRRIRQATWTSWLRLRVLEAASASPTARWPYPPLARGTQLPAIEGPAILAGFHLGPIPANCIVLEHLPGEVLVMHLSSSQRKRLTIVAVGSDAWSRAQAMQRAVETLRRGGFVFLLVDANEVPSTIDVSLFGRRARLARGAFALARLTGAPVIPMAPRWRGTRIEVVVGEPIPAADETAMADAAAAWLERFLRDSPGELGPLFANSF